jgi:flagellar motor switch protein FliG
MLGSALQRELPQTTAYVLSALPATVRAHVLREYPPELRQQIERHLNGSVHA